MTYVSVAVEGITDEAVVFKILSELGLTMINPPQICRGKTKLDPSLPGYNSAARFSPWFVLRDMDHDANCAPELVGRLLPNAERHMRFRIAVRSAESWLLADHTAFASFFGINAANIPPNPDGLGNPKQTVVNLCRRSSKRNVREGMLPEDGSPGVTGIAYVTLLSEFAVYKWRPSVAAGRSDSLRRCLRSLNW